MNIFFRVDASLDIGSGHVMRCLALAHGLKKMGANCRFITRAHAGNLNEAIRQNGFLQIALPEAPSVMGAVDEHDAAKPSYSQWLGASWEVDARQCLDVITSERCDWLIVDHYALDVRWESALRPACGRIMVIDDLADRSHHCDLLLDQNLGRTPDDYFQKVPSHCVFLVGPRYALLRDEFNSMRSYSLARRTEPALNQLLISLGGVDKDNVTSIILDALRETQLPADCRIIVVMGVTAPWLSSVRAKAASMPYPIEIRVDVNDMAKLMAESDLAIGAAGSTSWERCCLGLPAVMVVLAENQYAIAQALHGSGAAVNVGSPFDSNFLPRIQKVVMRMVEDSNSLLATSKLASLVTDGLGTGDVAKILFQEG